MRQVLIIKDAPTGVEPMLNNKKVVVVLPAYNAARLCAIRWRRSLARLSMRSS